MFLFILLIDPAGFRAIHHNATEGSAVVRRRRIEVMGRWCTACMYIEMVSYGPSLSVDKRLDSAYPEREVCMCARVIPPGLSGGSTAACFTSWTWVSR